MKREVVLETRSTELSSENGDKTVSIKAVELICPDKDSVSINLCYLVYKG